MKTSLGKLALIAAGLGTSWAAAQNVSPPFHSRGLLRLTLLPGPTLLAPASAPSPQVGAFPSFVAQPLHLAPPQSLLPVVPAATNVPVARPSPESLRFNRSLRTPEITPRMEFRPAPRPAF